MHFKVVKACSGDVYEVVPMENMSVGLGEAEALLEKNGYRSVANVQRFIIADSPMGVRFELHSNGRIEARTPEENVAYSLAEQVYIILEDTR